MACCKGTASWFCCYPDTCGCDACCCQGSNCSGGCSSSGSCGVGACCTCNSNNWNFAWRNATCCGGCGGACGLNYSCGTRIYFNHDATCTVWNPGTKVDNGPACSTGRMVDFTKSLFLQFAPLSTGLLSGVRASDSLTCC